MDTISSLPLQSLPLNAAGSPLLSSGGMQQWQKLLQDPDLNLHPGPAPTARAEANLNQLPAAPRSPLGWRDFVDSVDGKMKEAESLRAGLLRGEPVNLHQAIIALQEASVSFTLMMEFRNKLMEGYQELMRMQI